MNRERAKKLLPVIQAYAEGRSIQSRLKRTDSKWKFESNPNFGDEYFEFRVKPTLEQAIFDYLFGVYKEDSTGTATAKIMELIKEYEQ
jgi:hypothetical protein